MNNRLAFRVVDMAGMMARTALQLRPDELRRDVFGMLAPKRFTPEWARFWLPGFEALPAPHVFTNGH